MNTNDQICLIKLDIPHTKIDIHLIIIHLTNIITYNFNNTNIRQISQLTKELEKFFFI